jgi:hypothetical protein
VDKLLQFGPPLRGLNRALHSGLYSGPKALLLQARDVQALLRTALVLDFLWSLKVQVEAGFLPSGRIAMIVSKILTEDCGGIVGNNCSSFRAREKEPPQVQVCAYIDSEQL